MNCRHPPMPTTKGLCPTEAATTRTWSYIPRWHPGPTKLKSKTHAPSSRMPIRNRFSSVGRSSCRTRMLGFGSKPIWDVRPKKNFTTLWRMETYARPIFRSSRSSTTRKRVSGCHGRTFCTVVSTIDHHLQ